MVFVSKIKALTKDGKVKKGITVIELKNGQKRYLDKSLRGVRKDKKDKKDKVVKVSKCEKVVKKAPDGKLKSVKKCDIVLNE